MKERLEKLKNIDSTSFLFVVVLTVVLAFPLFILLYRSMPSIILPFGNDGFRIDHIILFMVIFFLLFMFIKRFKSFFVFFSIISLIAITILNFSGVYTLENLYTDYNKILYDLGDESLEKRFFMRNQKFTKGDVRNVANVSEVTINKCFKKIQLLTDKLVPKCILDKYVK